VFRRGVQFEMQKLDISRFQDADKCAAYLMMPQAGGVPSWPGRTCAASCL